MRIVVTGGAGFIGSHLCKRLLDDGHEVVCVDNLLTGQKRNITPFLKDKNFTFLKKDIVFGMLIKGRVDQIYNLASPASPVDYMRYNVETLRVGSIGLENALLLAKRNKARILHTSTSEVYGDPEIHPQPEDYFGRVNPYGPRSCYDEAKRYGEALIYAYHKRYKLDTAIVRIFNTYGPNMKVDDGRVVTNFINQALKGKKITVYGKGKQTRSFCYIDDMIEGLVATMDSKVEGPINLGNPEEFKIKKLAKLVLELTESKSKIIYQKMPQDDPLQRKPDISKAEKKIGFEPKIGLEEGVKRTIDYFKRLKKDK
jgi:nucleoside-diphosphate-sugar epimerase